MFHAVLLALRSSFRPRNVCVGTYVFGVELLLKVNNLNYVVSFGWQCIAELFRNEVKFSMEKLAQPAAAFPHLFAAVYLHG